MEKFLEVYFVPLDLDGDAIGVVADEAGELGLVREAINEGAKADALDDAAD
jgi:hypothetical protein